MDRQLHRRFEQLDLMIEQLDLSSEQLGRKGTARNVGIFFGMALFSTGLRNRVLG